MPIVNIARWAALGVGSTELGGSAARGSDPAVDGVGNSVSPSSDGSARAAQNRTKNAGIRKVARHWKRYGYWPRGVVPCVGTPGENRTPILSFVNWRSFR